MDLIWSLLDEIITEQLFFEIQIEAHFEREGMLANEFYKVYDDFIR